MGLIILYRWLFMADMQWWKKFQTLSSETTLMNSLRALEGCFIIFVQLFLRKLYLLTLMARGCTKRLACAMFFSYGVTVHVNKLKFFSNPSVILRPRREWSYWVFYGINVYVKIFIKPAGCIGVQHTSRAFSCSNFPSKTK